MAKEVEIKLISSKSINSDIKDTLLLKGFVLNDMIKEKAIYLDRKEGKIEGCLRVKIITRNTLDVKRNHCGLVTYKTGKSSGISEREEKEYTTESPDSALEVFYSLGFRPLQIVEKKRTSFKKKNVKVELDEVPFLGYFIEIESDNAEGVKNTCSQLGLGNLIVENRSYLEMSLQPEFKDKPITFDREEYEKQYPANNPR